MLIETIKSKLNAELVPEFLDVIDESRKHAIFQEGKITHIKVIAVSSYFENKNLLARHRMLNSCLQSELSQLRASSFSLFTPAEWMVSSKDNLKSPNCAGGNL